MSMRTRPSCVGLFSFSTVLLGGSRGGLAALFRGALIEWLADVDPQIDSSGPHEQGPLAEGALENVVWEGHTIRCTPLRLQLAVAERRGKLEDAQQIKAFQQLAGEN